MRFLPEMALILGIGALLAGPSLAERGGLVRGGFHRGIVSVHRGWPLRRPLPRAIIRPAPVRVRVAPLSFFHPIVWTSVVITSAPPPDAIVWQDRQTLVRDDDWTEFTLASGQRGSRLDLSIDRGRVQIDWAEVVFGNGQTQVVDFHQNTLTPGLYSLLQFDRARRIDHVRVLARSMSREAQIGLEMER